MLYVKQINEEDIDLCYELDSNTISLWSRNQWVNEFKKKDIKVFGLVTVDLVIGLCVFQVVLDEAQIYYFVINQNYRNRGFGSFLMNYLIKSCEKQNLNKLLLEVSHNNNVAENFYNHFGFSTVGIRRNYYQDGSNALLKEKKLTTKKFN